MSSERERAIYEELGLRPVVNAAGYVTVLGGSRVSPGAGKAAAGANRYFVEMEALLRRSGEIIAAILGAEAALVTSGCAAAMALGVAACLAGSDRERAERLPDTSGIPNEILIQASQRYKYDRCLTLSGARLIEVGDADQTTAAQLAAAITARTAAIHYFAPGGSTGVVPVDEVIDIAHQRSVPVLVDAASQVYPIEDLRRYTGLGADLVCYGAKYIGAPHSTGILCGRNDLVEAALMQSFVGYEAHQVRAIGRPMKVDRQGVVAVVQALREWVGLDHDARLAEHDRKVELLRRALVELPHISVAAVTDRTRISDGLRVTLDEPRLGKTAAQVVDALRSGDPSIWVRGGVGAFMVSVPNLVDGEEEIVARRLRELLAS